MLSRQALYHPATPQPQLEKYPGGPLSPVFIVTLSPAGELA